MSPAAARRAAKATAPAMSASRLPSTISSTMPASWAAARRHRLAVRAHLERQSRAARAAADAVFRRRRESGRAALQAGRPWRSRARRGSGTTSPARGRRRARCRGWRPRPASTRPRSAAGSRASRRIVRATCSRVVKRPEDVDVRPGHECLSGADEDDARDRGSVDAARRPRRRSPPARLARAR